MDIDWSKCPEATHFDPVDQNFLREIDHALLLFNNKNGWMVPMYTQYGVTIEECHRPLIKRAAWNGEGTPPAGTVCEMHRETYFEIDWQPVTLLCVGKAKAFFRDKDGHEWSRPIRELSFRPIRTPEQIAADKRLHEIRNALSAINSKVHFPNDLVRGNILTAAVEAMIDAGYHK